MPKKNRIEKGRWLSALFYYSVSGSISVFGLSPSSGPSTFLRYLSRKVKILLYALIWFSFFTNPWPSSSNNTYSTGTPFLRTPSTISSDSTWSTLGSCAPCKTINGLVTLSVWNSGDILRNRTESAEYGSPSSLYNAS